ncbi:ATP-dependent RNA helicase DBP2, partial [Durusdinium trenchii]
ELLEAGDGPVALIFVPTRELALDTKAQCDLYGWHCTIVGGTPPRQQREWLEDKNDIVVATPQRFMNALGDGCVMLNRATYVIIDEADEMLKKEFDDQIKLILSQVRKERQVLMFTATWPEEVKLFAQEICTSSEGMPPVVVRIGGSLLAACKFIEQHTQIVDGEEDKYEKLKEKLQSPEAFKDDSKAIIFCRTRDGVQRLFDRLKEEYFLWNDNDSMVACLHGGLWQHERDSAMKRFRSGEVPCVVSTGVLARDIPKVRFVFNYDLPSAPEEYIHRIGRTSGGAKGYAMSFIDKSSWQEMKS